MSWGNTHRSYAEAQLDSVTMTLPEEFTSKCVTREVMVGKMKTVLEEEKVHENEADLVYDTVKQLVNDAGANKTVQNTPNLKSQIDKMKEQLQAILDQKNQSTSTK